MESEDADPAAEVCAPPPESRRHPEQKRRAEIQPIPAEDARLGPQAKAGVKPQPASLQGGFKADRVYGP